MRQNYRSWLLSQGYSENTITSQIHRIGRVENYYGDVDGSYERDKLQSLIEALSYSTEDERRGRPNPTELPFVGNVRNNLASYKSAVLWYRRFREGVNSKSVPTESSQMALPPTGVLKTDYPIRRPSVPNVFEARLGPRTFVDFKLDGRACLKSIIADSQYRTIAQAVASLTLFSHPITVRQTGGKALFPAIRNPRRVGQIDIHDGRQVLLDDNKSPTDAFLWSNGLSRRSPDTQFNHIYAASLDVDAYTALPNICMTPAFIAKLTDTSDEVRALLRYRSFQLFHWVPVGQEPPPRPDEYETLEWAAPLPPIEDVRSVLLAAMSTKPKDRTVAAARQLGWLFSVPQLAQSML